MHFSAKDRGSGSGQRPSRPEMGTDFSGKEDRTTSRLTVPQVDASHFRNTSLAFNPETNTSAESSSVDRKGSRTKTAALEVCFRLQWNLSCHKCHLVTCLYIHHVYYRPDWRKGQLLDRHYHFRITHTNLHKVRAVLRHPEARYVKPSE